MLYVGSHKKENGVDYFGVTDTDDMVTEMVTKAQLWNIVNKQGVRIEGVVDGKIILLTPVFNDSGEIVGIEPRNKKLASSYGVIVASVSSQMSNESVDSRRERLLSELKQYQLSNNGPEPERFVFDKTYTKLVAYNPGGEETDIHIPSVRVIGAHCFDKLSEAIEYNSNHGWIRFFMPSTVEVIEDYAFANITLDSTSEFHTENVVYIGEYAFCNLQSQGISFSFPSIERIGKYAFACGVHEVGEFGCFDYFRLDTLELGDKLIEIPEGMCDDCLQMEHIVLGKSVRSIGKYAFRWCDALREINLPDSLIEIGECAFEGYETLDTDDWSINRPHIDLVIPPLVQSIGDRAFARHCSIYSIHGFQSVSKKGKDIFKDCANLFAPDMDSVGVAKQKTSVMNFIRKSGLSVDSFVFDDSYTTLLRYIPTGSDDIITLPPVTGIGSRCFESLASATKGYVTLILPDSVEFIGDYAFNGLKLRSNSVFNTANVKRLGKFAFGNLDIEPGSSKLFKLSFPSVEYVGTYAFAYSKTIASFDNGIQVLEFGDNLRRVSYRACYGCLALQEVNLGSVDWVEEEAFFNCVSLRAINIPASCNEIMARAFAWGKAYDASKLPYSARVDLVISNIVRDGYSPATYVRDEAFANNMSIYSYKTVGHNVKISDTAFKGCRNLVR